MGNGLELYAQYEAWIWIAGLVAVGALFARRQRSRSDRLLPARRAGMVSIEPGATLTRPGVPRKSF